MPWSPTPGSSHHLACSADNCVDFHRSKNVVLPTWNISGLNPFNLTAYGLSARYLTLKTLRYHKASKDSLPGGWPTFRGGVPTRLITRPCPAALDHIPVKFQFDHVQKTCQKRSILARFKNQNYFQKTSRKWSILKGEMVPENIGYD